MEIPLIESDNEDRSIDSEAENDLTSVSTDFSIHEIIGQIRFSENSSSNNLLWKEVRDRCRRESADLSTLDGQGRTCLHVACSRKAPLSVIKAITEASASKEEFSMRCDKHGRTPLALAICSGAESETLLYLLNEAQEGVKKPDVMGRLPLHIACDSFGGNRTTLIQELLRVYPEACSLEAHDGKTPLHLAIESRYSSEAIELLVKACPNSARNGSCGLIPLFLAIRFDACPEVIALLTEAYPASVGLRDRGGQYAYFRAIENRASLKSQEILVGVTDEVVSHCNAWGDTALHKEFNSKVARSTTVSLALTKAPQIATHLNLSGESPLNLALAAWYRLNARSSRTSSRVENAWKCLEYVAKAAYYHKCASDEDGYFTLHAAVGLELPSDIILTCLEKFPSQASRLDSHGRSALQAALDPIGARHVLRISCVDSYYDLKKRTVQQLLHLDPESVHRRDSKGQSMMTIAAKSTSIPLEVFSELWGQCSDLLRSRDPVTQLYPFQIAALPKKPLPRLKYEGITRSWWAREDELQLDTIFLLLRQAPETLMKTSS